MKDDITSFECEHYSIAERGKQRSGDHVVVRVADPYVILAVSDGVGSRPCDWLASKTACQGLIENFFSYNAPLSERLRHSVEAAHRIVQSQSGDCSGMLATLVAAVWNTEEDHAYIVSVGDSRIYHASARAVLQVSIDDSSAEVYTRFGKPHLVGGAAVTYPVITKAIGQLQPLAVEVQTILFGPGESLILASDGMYHVPSLETRLLTAVRFSRLSDGLAHVISLCTDDFADDATIAVLRRNDLQDPGVYQRLLESGEDYRTHNAFGHCTAHVLLATVRERIDRGDFGSCVKLIAYAGLSDLQFSKAEAISLLDAVAAHPRRTEPAAAQLFEALRNTARRMSL